MLKSMKILALLAGVSLSSFTFSAASAAGSSSPATQGDVLEAYSKAQDAAESAFKAEEDKYVSALQRARDRSNSAYRHSSDQIRKAQEVLEQPALKRYQQALADGRGDAHYAARRQVVSAQASADKTAFDAERASNDAAAARFRATAERLNGEFVAASKKSGATASDLTAANDTFQTSLKQAAQEYADAVKQSRLDREAAVAANSSKYTAETNRLDNASRVDSDPYREALDAVRESPRYLALERAKDRFERDDKAADTRSGVIYSIKIKPALAAKLASRAKRVEIWHQYEAGVISADVALAQLNALAQHLKNQ